MINPAITPQTRADIARRLIVPLLVFEMFGTPQAKATPAQEEQAEEAADQLSQQELTTIYNDVAAIGNFFTQYNPQHPNR